MSAHSPKHYLLIDDHAGRAKLFNTQVAGEDLVIDCIAEANELQDLRDDLEVLTGVIVDFHLNTSTNPEYPYLKYPCAAEGCHHASREPSEEHTSGAGLFRHPVNVTTGLGAMLYVKQHAPDVALYGFCELTADHSWMFLAAARLWLGASAINANYAPDQLHKALTSGAPEGHMPINMQLAHAEGGFVRLIDSLDFLTNAAEAYDWLGEYRFSPSKNTLAEFKRRLSGRFGRGTLETDIYIRIMCRWQRALASFVKPFNVDVSLWPDLTDVQSVKHWDEYNPVLEFVRSGHLETFFTEPDVRAALTYYRAERSRLAEEDNDYAH